MNKGITFVDFHSVGKTSDTIDLLKMTRRELETKSAHSRRSHAKILIRPVALDLQSLGIKKKLLKESVVFEFESMFSHLNII